jgi:hypothetical protein
MTNIYFSIPLAGWRNSEQWRQSMERLRATLHSILRNQDENILVVISGHEKPVFDLMDDKRIHFIESEFDKPLNQTEFTRDKGRKQRSNYNFILKHGAGYIVLSDADDLFHKDLPRYIRATNSEFGYILKKGFVYSLLNKSLALVPGAWSKSFDAICGSSAIIKVAESDRTAFLHSPKNCFINHLGPHNLIDQNLLEMKRPLSPIEWPACVYMLSNSETVSSIINRTPDRQIKLNEIIQERRIVITSDIVENFGYQF